MKELSKEIIEIGGKEYTLFLNRKGIVAWEKYTKQEEKKYQELQKKYASLDLDKIVNNFDELDDKTNPFEGLEEIDDMDSDKELIIKLYERLYWIMLYTEHKLSISEAKELYDQARKEYGDEQVVLLGKQMIDDVNNDPNQNENLKNLKALRPKKI